MKYKIFFSDSIETLRNETLIGEANTYQDACVVLNSELRKGGRDSDPYWRFIMNENATFIDYGSWTRFAAIVPPVPMQVITGEIEEE